jgi:hypothetical protein
MSILRGLGILPEKAAMTGRMPIALNRVDKGLARQVMPTRLTQLLLPADRPVC